MLNSLEIYQAYSEYEKAMKTLENVLNQIVDPKTHDNYNDISFDDYDNSLEIHFCSDNIAIKDEDLYRIGDMGFYQMWINYSDRRGREDPNYKEIYKYNLPQKNRDNFWITDVLFGDKWRDIRNELACDMCDDTHFDDIIVKSEDEIILTNCKEITDKTEKNLFDIGFRIITAQSNKY